MNKNAPVSQQEMVDYLSNCSIVNVRMVLMAEVMTGPHQTELMHVDEAYRKMKNKEFSFRALNKDPFSHE